MKIGSGIALIVIGAIITFALQDNLITFINQDLLGQILMGAGVVIVLLALIFINKKRSAVTETRTAGDPVSGERVTRRESSIN
jgi:hypothetical protein